MKGFEHLVQCKEFSIFLFFIFDKKDVYSKNCYMQSSTKHIKQYKKKEKSKNIKRKANHKERES